MIRKMDYKEPLEMLVEILVDVQLEGSFEKYSAPGWSEGTACEEVINAVRLIGDGEWLSEHYAEGAAQGNAEKWLTEYLEGKSVPLPTDKRAEPKVKTKKSSRSDVSVPLDKSLPEALQEYLSHQPNELRERLSKRLKDGATLKKFVQNINDTAMAIGLCIVPDVDDRAFETAEKPYMAPEALADEDMLAMSRYFLVELSEELFDNYGVAGPQLKIARARSKWFNDHLVAPANKTLARKAPPAKRAASKPKPKTKG